MRIWESVPGPLAVDTGGKGFYGRAFEWLDSRQRETEEADPGSLDHGHRRKRTMRDYSRDEGESPGDGTDKAQDEGKKTWEKPEVSEMEIAEVTEFGAGGGSDGFGGS